MERDRIPFERPVSIRDAGRGNTVRHVKTVNGASECLTDGRMRGVGRSIRRPSLPSRRRSPARRRPSTRARPSKPLPSTPMCWWLPEPILPSEIFDKQTRSAGARNFLRRRRFAGLDHHEIVGRKHRLVDEHGKGDRRMRAAAVIVVGQHAGRLVVDDVVVAIERLDAGPEEGRVQRDAHRRRAW